MSRRALTPAEVLRLASGPQLKAAVDAINKLPDASQIFLSTAVDAEANLEGQRAALQALVCQACAEAVEAILFMAHVDGVGEALDLYNVARALPIAALMRYCDCGSSDQVRSMQDMELTSVSDLVRYCRFDEDAAADGQSTDELDEIIGMLALETEGELSRRSLRALIDEARALCAVTASVRRRCGSSSSLGARMTGANVALLEAALQPELGPDEEMGPTPGTRSVGC